jgi:organic radical activating enzyme
MINKITGFHIEPTNICTLKCEGCARTQFINQWPQHWTNKSINVNSLMNFLDIDLTGLKIILCGVYGDPIYHPEFHDLLQKLKNRGSHITVVTNGSYKDTDWWNITAKILTADDSIYFSIDGIPDNFTQYRKNADWVSIELGIKIMAQSSCRTVWKFIPFAFNQTQINQAQQLAMNLGIDEFLLDPSDRFDEKTQYLVPDADFLGPRYSLQNSLMKGTNVVIDPKCTSGREHFISATGHYVPCCYVKDHRFYYKTIFGKNQKNFQIEKNTITQLLKQPDTIEFYQNKSNFK